MAMRKPDASMLTSIFHAHSYFFHSGYVLYTTYWHQNTCYRKIKTQTQKRLVCWLSTQLSGLFRASTGAKSCNGWLSQSLKVEARTTPWATKSAKNKTQELLGSLFPIQDTGSGFLSTDYHVRATGDDTRRLHAWFGDGLCTFACTVTDALGNQQKIFEDRVVTKSEHS